MHTVMGPYCDLVEMIRDFDPGEASRERLLVDVGVVKNSCSQDAAVIVNDLPPVGIVFPASVSVRDRYRKVVDTPVFCFDINPDDIGFPGEDVNVLANQACNEQDKGSDHHLCLSLTWPARHFDAERVRLGGKFARLA